MQRLTRKMFERNKQADGASAASAQGIERKGNEDSLRQESNSGLSIQGPELARPGLPVMQNRQGYCNCCHVHYSNLEQHVSSSQHRHFATYCRNRMGTTSLMERFLQDVLQHHPYSYDDNRPTYDDMPFTSSQLPGDEALLSLDVMEKERTASREEEPNSDSGFTAESGCLVTQRSQEELRKASMAVTPLKKLEGGQEHSLGNSEKPLAIPCSTKDIVPVEGALSESSNHKVSFTSVNLLTDPVSVNHSPSTPHRLSKNIQYPVVPESVSSNRCEQSNHDICNEEGVFNPSLNVVLKSTQSKTVPLSQESPVCNQGNSLISGQLFLKQDDLQPQDETQISDVSLRNTSNPVGTSSSPAFQADSQVSGNKESKLDGNAEIVGETSEEILLKCCDKTAPSELPSRDDDTNSCVNILTLLDHNSAHGSDISFDCDAAVPAVQSGTVLPKATVKSLELLKEVQVNLQDENYGTQLSSILKSGSLQQETEAVKDVSAQKNEPVLPALPHVPPSFVGKTWSQIMYEDDMKIEALVRDFREGRFRCHFDSESLANCAKRRARKKKQEEGGISADAANETEAVSAKGLPEFTDVLSVASDFSNPSVISETQPVPETSKRPKKRTWRLASRCQVVKVSHGTQTSLVHYPIVKQKIIRKDCDPPDQKGSPVWSENEKTPTMKTRLCALKLPESYTKIMSPVQPQTVVYVLSCPEIKQFRSKVDDIPKVRRNQHCTDSKDSVRYKYKQNSIRYYDPLTNRVLKTPPKNMAGEKSRNPPHIRQLFKSLSVDANQKKQADSEFECIMPKSFNSTDFHGSSASFLLHTVKENDMNSSHKTDGSSVSTESSECLVCNNSEKSYKNVVLSPLNSHQSQQEGDFRLTPLRSRMADGLERDNPKKKWRRKKGSSREPGISKKASGSAFVRCSPIRRGSKKRSPKTTAQQKRGRIRISSCTSKSSASSTCRYQRKKNSVGKHLKKEKLDAKKLKVTRKSKRTFLNPATIMGIPEKKRGTARSSSKVKKWEVRGDESLLCTVK
ncbi:DBF4-type zinc finger-containing protein 2 isoform X2 [Sceloporus undulatus]|uniref:DBF4-type zinc finger-containing protein 2 isoform X2 n=1 Tax=Sceloporus undulatus TaxID=8520 RepID=UPI001C4BFF2A|nr:DBF4-type zinc finger-containing protein 2 isoform X2 [Sceloporus undulatus]